MFFLEDERLGADLHAQHVPARMAADDDAAPVEQGPGRRPPATGQQAAIARHDFDERHYDAFRCGEGEASSVPTAAKTSAGVRSRMHAWSVVQIRCWQGPHGTAFCKWIARKIGFGPRNVRRAEQRDDRPIERRRKVARPAIGRHQQRRAAYQRLGQPERQRLIGETVHARPSGQRHNRAGQVALRGPAQNDHSGIAPIDEVLRQRGERLGRPMFRRAERRPRIEANHLRVFA